MTKSKAEKICSSRLIDDGIEELDGAMRPNDLIWILQHLKLPGGHCLLRIDKDIRQFLVRVLQDRETAHLLRSPRNAARLLKSIADANAGKLVEQEI